MSRRIGKQWTVKLPSLADFKGRPLRAYLESLDAWLRKFQGAMQDAPGMATDAIVILSSTVTARSGATMGSGSATLMVQGDAGALSSADTITVWNITASSFASGKYAIARRVRGYWVLAAVEC
jgi:hypothetical protein